MGATVASLSGKSIEAIEKLESVVRTRRNNLLIAVIICTIIFVMISMEYISYSWLWLIIPIFIISLGILIPVQTAYWDITKYAFVGKLGLEATEKAAELRTAITST